MPKPKFLTQMRMTKQVNKSRLIFLGFLVMPFFNYAQEIAASQGKTVFSNALFNTLLVLIIALMIVIIALGQVLKNIASSEFILNKFKNKDVKSDTTKTLSVVFLLLAGYPSLAQTSAAAKNEWLIGGLVYTTFFSLITIIAIESIIIVVLYFLIMGFVKTEKQKVPAKTKAKTILEKINASVDIEKEHDILLDHDYDGIKELDNDLPPWWKYGFYLTIFIGIVYLTNYHVLGTGDLQKEEYEISLVTAKAEIAEYMKTAANNVDETTVKQLGAADVEKGKELFISTCAACHGNDGRGTVGPNLTDEYWLHGGSVVDIFKTIKYGWVDKGMKSWKEDLSAMQIAQIASFIRTLKGTNPAGAKASQGDLYKEENMIINDSTAVVIDSLTVKQDTLK
jgi:cytochrome c oxidase cbb3-type subunit 3